MKPPEVNLYKGWEGRVKICLLEAILDFDKQETERAGVGAVRMLNVHSTTERTTREQSPRLTSMLNDPGHEKPRNVACKSELRRSSTSLVHFRRPDFLQGFCWAKIQQKDRKPEISNWSQLRATDSWPITAVRMIFSWRISCLLSVIRLVKTHKVTWFDWLSVGELRVRGGLVRLLWQVHPVWEKNWRFSNGATAYLALS